ncbi:unnamed protein product [Paramecium primaurelia]|uniref:Uncharacterized protein n=1 Tax=Paramecium primaurelia TaxID=5886 RepID=A0A8S1PRY0_PARPR|nr:unnamed protein product [Paramecium primaurelia]
MYISLTSQNKTWWTHTSLVPSETHQKVFEVINGVNSFQNKASLISTYLSLEAVNRIPVAKKLAIYYKAAIVGATFFGSRIAAGSFYQSNIKSEVSQLLDGAPIWENKFDVPELDKKFFFIDDDNNFEPSLWHHGINSIEKPKVFYKHE